MKIRYQLLEVVLSALLLMCFGTVTGAQQMAERERHAFQGGAQVADFAVWPLHDFDADAHATFLPGSTKVSVPEMTRPRSSPQNTAPAITRLIANNTNA